MIWLPAAFSVAFWGLLWLSPNLSSLFRAGMAILFGAVGSALWFDSGLGTGSSAQVALAIIAVIGIGMAIAGRGKAVTWPILALISMGWLVCYFSSSHGGAGSMVDWVMQVFGWSRDTADLVIVILRKTIHLTFYALVAFLGVVTSRKNGGTGTIAIGSGLLMALAFASFDEVRQSTQIGRGGSIWDVLLDMTGAAVAVGLATKPWRAGR